MLMNELTFSAQEQDIGQRIDKWIILQYNELSRNAVQKLIDDGFVSVNGTKVSKNYKIRANDSVEIIIPKPTALDAVAQNIPITIVYEDDELLVCDKPKGMVVHPAHGNSDGTLVNALLYHCGERLSSINGVIRPGIVHRIDKNTSGLLIVAKTDNSHIKLAEQIKAHTFTREYYAVICGRMNEPNGTIDKPIGRDKYDRKRMCVTERNSKNAITHYETLSAYENYALMRFMLETGRTHQIRVHCANAGHAIFGDDVYGKKDKDIDGQCLHAGRIGFIHPKTNQYLEFSSELPDYFIRVCNKLKLDYSKIN